MLTVPTLFAVLGRPGGVPRRGRDGSGGEAIRGLRGGSTAPDQRELPPEQTVWLASAREPAVGRALMLMHHRSAHPWTLLSLAHEVGVSRSVLSERMSYSSRGDGQPAQALFRAGRAHPVANQKSIAILKRAKRGLVICVMRPQSCTSVTVVVAGLSDTHVPSGRRVAV